MNPEKIIQMLIDVVEKKECTHVPEKAIWPGLEEAIEEKNVEKVRRIIKDNAPNIDSNDDNIVLFIAKRIAFHDKTRGAERHRQRCIFLLERAFFEVFNAVEGHICNEYHKPCRGEEFSPFGYAALGILILTLQRRGYGGKWGLGVMSPTTPMAVNRYCWEHMPTPHSAAWAAWDAAMVDTIGDLVNFLRIHDMDSRKEWGDDYPFIDEQDEMETLLEACLHKQVLKKDEVLDFYLQIQGYNANIPWPDWYSIPEWAMTVYSTTTL